jgi:CubicO group peptidase (beta-lactamase class C family)
MISTAHDLLVFFDALFTTDALLTATERESLMPSVPTGGERFPAYGLGVERWEEGGRWGVGHGGHEFGYRTFAYHFPEEDVTFVLWVNVSSLTPTAENSAVIIDAHRLALRDLVLAAED